jgi:hypothetical protein
MRDDEDTLCLSSEAIDVVIAEVKTNQFCALNGPWTARERENVHRVLAAIGCVQRNTIDVAAAGIYRDGIYEDRTLRIRPVAVGGDRSSELAGRFPQVTQVTWPQILDFIWHRFRTYRRQKTQVQQWNGQGLLLKRLADESAAVHDFITTALSRMR